MKTSGWILAALLSLALVPTAATATTSGDVQARVDADLEAGKPIVVHVVVALCDNANQGIVPVPAELGNGQDPRSNLYWGALYGVRTYLPRSAGWNRLAVHRAVDERILERVVMYAELERGGRDVPVYLVADAWDGSRIREATSRYLDMTAGRSVLRIPVERDSGNEVVRAGGAAHVVAYVGHNGLMDFRLPAPASAADETPPRSAIVLACASKSYFSGHLDAAGAHPLLLTTGLMAPEAYTLDAAVQAWVAEGTTEATTEGAAEAYDRYQKCGLSAARRLFWGQP